MQHAKTVEDWEEGLLNLQGEDLDNTQVHLPLERLKEFVRTTIHTAVLAREAELREKISGMAFVDAAQAGQFAMHTDGYNQAIEEVLALLTRKEPLQS